MKKNETNEQNKKTTCSACGREIKEGWPCVRCTVKPGNPCPDCGQTLKTGGPSASAYCPRCGSVFGKKSLPPPKPGDRCAGHTSEIETWLARELKLDGKTVVQRAMLFRFMPPPGGAARLALDGNNGALLLQFNNYPNGAECCSVEPEELAFYCTDTLGNVETWRAFYKERSRMNSKTDKRERFRPCFLCRVERVPYDTEERAQFEERERRRESARRMQEDAERREIEARERNAPQPAAAHLLTIRQAAEYARVDEKTIRAWLVSRDGDKPMLPGAIKAGRKVRIPRTDLDPWRKAAKATRTPKTTRRKRPARKPVKRKS